MKSRKLIKKSDRISNKLNPRKIKFNNKKDKYTNYNLTLRRKQDNCLILRIAWNNTRKVAANMKLK